PAGGKSWNLVVIPRQDISPPLEATNQFTTVAPVIADYGFNQGLPGYQLDLLIDAPGTGKLTVLFGNKKAKPVPPVPANTAPLLLTVFVPKPPPGIYPLPVANGVGPSNTVDFTILATP